MEYSNRRLARFALLSLICLAASVLLAQDSRFDVLIAGAKVVDGSGNPWFYADVAIKGDTIAFVGPPRAATAVVRIGGAGLVVAPGFIDVHSHGAGGGPFYPGPGGIFDVPSAENYLREGVTTIIEGPDGYSPLPIASLLDRVSRTPISINFATLVGQGSIREEVIGPANRKASAEEIDRMKALAATAMRDGAFGLSTGLFYVPGSYTPTEEIIDVARVVGRMGGIHISHMRDETSQVLESVMETIRIGEEAGLPTQITHHKIVGKDNWGKSIDTLKLVEEARARGVDVTLDQYPYTASSTGLYALLPQWALEGGRPGTRRRLASTDDRGRIKAAIVNSLRFERGGGDPKNVVIVSCDFDPSLAGKTLADLTRARSVEPSFENSAETVIALEERGDCAAVYHAMSEDDVRRIMRSPYTMIGSDGIIPVFGQGAPHPRSYATFARVLAVYVRETKVLTLEEAVRKMSGFPAQRLKMWDRGTLRPGMKADLVLIDPEAIADRANFDRPHQYAVGVRDVIVNGRIVLRDGAVTPERPGRVLYGPGRE